MVPGDPVEADRGDKDQWNQHSDVGEFMVFHGGRCLALGRKKTAAVSRVAKHLPLPGKPIIKWERQPPYLSGHKKSPIWAKYARL